MEYTATLTIVIDVDDDMQDVLDPQDEAREQMLNLLYSGCDIEMEALL